MFVHGYYENNKEQHLDLSTLCCWWWTDGLEYLQDGQNLLPTAYFVKTFILNSFWNEFQAFQNCTPTIYNNVEYSIKSWYFMERVIQIYEKKFILEESVHCIK